MIQDTHHIRLISDRLFEEDLDCTKPNSSTVENLKNTFKKWKIDDQIDLENAKKVDFVKHLEKVIKENKFYYNRTCIKPINGSQTWFESAFGIRLFERISCSTKNGIELYLLKNKRNSAVYNLSYDPYKDQWTSSIILKNKENTSCVVGDHLKTYYNKMKTVIVYIEKRNAYANSSLFTDFLNKDIISYIRSFL